MEDTHLTNYIRLALKGVEKIKEQLEARLSREGFQIETAENLEAAVAASHQNARIHLNNTSARDMSQFPQDQGATTKVRLLRSKEETTRVLRKLAISCGAWDTNRINLAERI